MEGLIRLVAESFVRHGLEVEPVVAAALKASDPNAHSTQAPPTEALLAHNYRMKLEDDPVT